MTDFLHGDTVHTPPSDTHVHMCDCHRTADDHIPVHTLYTYYKHSGHTNTHRHTHTYLVTVPP